MSRIDAFRLAQVLSSLSKPKGDLVAKQKTTANKMAGKTKDISQLRDSISQRLRPMRGRQDFADLAPNVAVQEILCWEFGTQIIEHGEFERVVNDVVKDMFADDEARDIIRKIVVNLSGSD